MELWRAIRTLHTLNTYCRVNGSCDGLVLDKHTIATASNYLDAD